MLKTAFKTMQTTNLIQQSSDTDRYAFFRSIGSPKFIVAPMVDQSELPYRMLTRKYGANLCYTPMLHSRMFAEGEGYRKEFFTPNPEDRPLCVQFCGNDPATLLKAAKYVENDCDAVDINFGCPQGIARRGKYGSFLLEKTELIRSLISTLHQNLKVPVTCKMRCLPNEKDTLALAKVMQDAGCAMLVVHGRCREHNKQEVGPANWTIIKKIKEHLQIPVIANGGISTYEDCLRCMEYTGCDGVMSSEAILEYPALFDNGRLWDLDKLAWEYLEMVERYPGEADLKNIRSHLHKFLHSGLKIHTDLRDRLSDTKSMDTIREVAKEMIERRKGQDPASKITWYYRYWPSMSITKGEDQTYAFTDWDLKIANDPLFNKRLRDQEKKKTTAATEVVSDNVLESGALQMDLGSFLDLEESPSDQVEGCDDCVAAAKDHAE